MIFTHVWCIKRKKKYDMSINFHESHFKVQKQNINQKFSTLFREKTFQDFYLGGHPWWAQATYDEKKLGGL